MSYKPTSVVIAGEARRAFPHAVGGAVAGVVVLFGLRSAPAPSAAPSVGPAASSGGVSAGYVSRRAALEALLHPGVELGEDRVVFHRDPERSGTAIDQLVESLSTGIRGETGRSSGAGAGDWMSLGGVSWASLPGW